MTFCLHHWLLSAQVSLDQVDSATLQRLLQRFAVQHKSWADTAVSVWCTSFPDRLHLDAARVAAVRSSIGAQVAVRRSSSQKRATATNRTTANALQLCYSCATILLQSCYSLGTLVLQSCYSLGHCISKVGLDNRLDPDTTGRNWEVQKLPTSLEMLHLTLFLVQCRQLKLER